MASLIQGDKALHAAQGPKFECRLGLAGRDLPEGRAPAAAAAAFLSAVSGFIELPQPATVNISSARGAMCEAP